MKLDVVALPDSGRLAGVHLGGRNFVDGAAIILFAFETIAIQNLHFVTALHIDSAVAASLALGLGHIRNPKFHVQFEMAVKLLFRDDVAAFDLNDSTV